MASLDMLRGLAAFAVMVGHYRGLAFEDYSSESSGLAKPLYFLTGLGHQAVVVFFVLSGFFVGGGVLRALRDDRWSWRSYAVRRLARLYTVLIPALVLTWLLDHLGMQIERAAPMYAGLIPNHVLNVDIASRHDLALLLANAAFLQSIFVPTFGSNVALWSLSYEFWFYVLFPALCLAGSARRSGAVRIAYATVAAAVAWLLWGEPLAYFFVWLLGAAVAWFLETRALRCTITNRVRLGSLALLATALALSRVIQSSVFDLVLGASVMPFIVSVAGSDWQYSARVKRVAKQAAEMSFTVYAAHLPVLLALIAVSTSSRQVLSTATLTMAFLHLSAALLVLYGLWWAFERRTDLVRSWLDVGLGRAIGRKPSS